MLVVILAVAAVAESVDAADSPDHILVHIFLLGVVFLGPHVGNDMRCKRQKRGKLLAIDNYDFAMPIPCQALAEG